MLNSTSLSELLSLRAATPKKSHQQCQMILSEVPLFLNPHVICTTVSLHSNIVEILNFCHINLLLTALHIYLVYCDLSHHIIKATTSTKTIKELFRNISSNSWIIQLHHLTTPISAGNIEGRISRRSTKIIICGNVKLCAENCGQFPPTAEFPFGRKYRGHFP